MCACEYHHLLCSTHTEYEDPDKSENGMVYFDLPPVEDDEEDELVAASSSADDNNNAGSKRTTAPAGVADFWRFLFEFFFMQWLGKTQTKRIKNE